jgi:CRP/FNR family transcriptional regulator, cyclic AMP receptor protein
MSSKIEDLKCIPIFALLDDEELAVLAEQVEVRNFAARERIYKADSPGDSAYVVISGRVRVTTIDDDQQEVLIDEPQAGGFFGFASLLDQTPHATTAVACEDTVCIEVDRNDIAELLQRKPLAAMDLLATLGRHLHQAERLVRVRSLRDANDIIDEKETVGEGLSDKVAKFGGSWRFILSFGAGLVVYTIINIVLGPRAWDPYPFILLNLILSMLAAVQAPIIMMSQNRQDKKDRLRSELDYAVNRRSEAEIQGLARKLNTIEDLIADLKAELKSRRLA